VPPSNEMDPVAQLLVGEFDTVGRCERRILDPDKASQLRSTEAVTVDHHWRGQLTSTS
jgi:hypothetical protein